jgi:hypothetical protein
MGLCGIEDRELSSNRLVSIGFRAVYRSRLFNALIYPLQGFAAHKGAFCGSAEQTYCAFQRGLALSQLIKMPRACNVADRRRRAPAFRCTCAHSSAGVLAI